MARNNLYDISSHYLVTRQADLMSVFAGDTDDYGDKNEVSFIGSLRGSDDFSNCVPSKKARRHILSRDIPMSAIAELSDRIYKHIIKSLKRTYPKLKPNEYIMVDGFRDQIIPLPKQHDFEIYVTGTTLKIILNMRDSQK